MGSCGVRFELRVGEIELAAWRAAAAGRGLTVSEFVRRQVGGVLRAGLPQRWPGVEADGEVVGSWREVFLVALSFGWTVRSACGLAGVSRTLVYRERQRSREFGVSWELALEAADDRVRKQLREDVVPSLRRRRFAAVEAVDVRRGARPGSQADARVQVRLEAAELEAWRKAAGDLGVPVAVLVRRVVNPSGPVVSGRAGTPASWRSAFIDGLRRSGSVAAACRAAGVSRTLVYRERAVSPAFAMAWGHADAEARDRWDDLLLSWAMGIPAVKRVQKTRSDGTVDTITSEYKRYSNWALREWLRRRDPERFGGR